MKAELEVWREYYRLMRQYERWQYIESQTQSFFRDMKIETQGTTGADEELLSEYFSVLSELKRIAHDGAARFALTKPARPLGLDRALLL